MPNFLNNYNPQFWANEALAWLKSRKGMASRVYRRFEGERNDFGFGDTVNFRRPTKFVTAPAPGSAYQDINTGTAQCQLNIHREVPIVVTDRELAYSGQRLIAEHIGPAADAIGEYIDQYLCGLFIGCPHTVDLPSSVASTMPATLASIREVMVRNLVPADGKPRHYYATPTTVTRALGTSAFTTQQGAGDQGIAAQNTGAMGSKFGFDWFESTNHQSLQGDSITAPAGAGPNVVAGTPGKNTAIVTLNTAAAQSATLRRGMVIAITDTTSGLTEKYAVTADTTPTGNNWVNVPISPGLRRPLGASSTWAIVTTVGTGVASYAAEPIFHPNAAALVMVPLPIHGPDMGARMWTANDPDSGISIRARMAYESRNAQVHVILDFLAGGVLLDPDLAVRGCVR